MKSRKISGYIKTQAGKPFGRILVFTGARQTGKTTLSRKVFPEYSYISIEDPVSRGDYAGLTASQWKNLYPAAILDEVQKEPRLIESIKAVYDQWTDPRYVLLGSSQLLLQEKVKESLAGRCTIVELFTLTVPEIETDSWQDDVHDSLFQLCIKNPGALPEFLPSFRLDKKIAEKQKAWDWYLKYGGYPALTTPELTEEDKYLWLKNYVRTYLERDVRDLAAFRDLDSFIKLQLYLALQTGCLVNASAIAVQLGLSAKTVQRYIRYLELSYQAVVLPAWSGNKNKRLVKAPKIHYLDNGVLQAVLQKRGGLTGQEFESLTVSEMYKQVHSAHQDARFYHLRTHDGREVDLLIELPQGYLAFEIKMAEHVNHTAARHFKDLSNILDKPLLHSFVVSNDVETHVFNENITALNAAYFLG